MAALIPHGRALYYPYLEIKDRAWIKTAALFYDGLDRIVPPGYKTEDNRTVKALNHHFGFLRDVDPGGEAENVTDEFRRFILSRMRTAQDREETLQKLKLKFDYGRTFSIRAEKVGRQLITELPRLGFKLYPGADKKTFIFDEVTGSLYMAFLANHLARYNDTPVVTDDLLFQPLIRNIQEEDSGDRGFDLATIVIACAVPEPVENIPIRKIIAFRKRHSDEREDFYDGINQLVSDVTTAKDPASLREIMEYKSSQLMRKARNLRKSFNGVKINTAVGLFSASVPAIATGAGAVGAGIAVALLAGGKAASGLADIKKARAGSPVSYVLSLRNLRSSTLLEDLLHRKLLL